ncbi:hypothetical protein CPB83DRAFT_892332 [Crepidotus variabilis]|uniref:Hsp70 family protein n=1 Tax=Crepidotus variabilis TaxID=179855 RepID=A0A9P6EKD4_9AGAR|nr:hypothetical protein CPB83DRAFT_892332 [Crepidotus variabilis]
MSPREFRRHSLGPELIVAIDIGTTFTASSYSLRDAQGTYPRFQEINRWSGQANGDAKVPSVLYYNGTEPKLFGAETEDLELLIEAEEAGWQKAEWWKLSLRPDHLLLPAGFRPAPLPTGLSVDNIYRDFFAFIKQTLRAFIKKAHGLSDEVFDNLEASMNIILTTPNGWEGYHHHRIRMAALSAGLVPQDEGHRIRFAALHYAIENNFLNFEREDNVLVCDAGGGTTDIGIYKISSLRPLILDEICSPECYVTGGTFVNEAAKLFIEAQIQGTAWNRPECITTALREFEKFAKRRFTGAQPSSYVTLDASTESATNRGIVRGRLNIPRVKMCSFFDPLINIVIDGLEECRISLRSLRLDRIVLVGGFAESEYVYSKIFDWASTLGVLLGKPDAALAKAIPHGALHWHIRAAVRGRIAKYHYGAETDVAFCSGDPDMHGRERFTNLLGERRVRGAWQPIIGKGSRIRQNEDIKSSFYREFGELDETTTEIEIYAYRFRVPPKFFKSKGGNLKDGFIYLGTVKADLTKCFNAATFEVSPIGKMFKRLTYEVCISFEEIELKARLRWKEENKYVSGPAVISYDV